MIQKLTESQLEPFLNLLAAYQDFYKVSVPRSKSQRFFLDLLSNPSEGQVLLSIVENQVVGFSTICFHQNSLMCQRSGYLHDLFIEEGFRKQGHAQALMFASVEYAKKNGLNELYWHTSVSNVAAQSLYDSLTPYKSNWVSYAMKLT